jgi:hypothetical protein
MAKVERAGSDGLRVTLEDEAIHLSADGFVVPYDVAEALREYFAHDSTGWPRFRWKDFADELRSASENGHVDIALLPHGDYDVLKAETASDGIGDRGWFDYALPSGSVRAFRYGGKGRRYLGKAMLVGRDE